MALIRVGQYQDARELLLATTKAALRFWWLATGCAEPARNTDAVYFARLLREVHQIDRPTFRAVRNLAQGCFDGNTAAAHLATVQEIHDAVYWGSDGREGGVS